MSKIKCESCGQEDTLFFELRAMINVNNKDDEVCHDDVVEAMSVWCENCEDTFKPRHFEGIYAS